MSNQLCECRYCGGVRVYDPTHSCPGCGADLPKPEPKKKEAPMMGGAYNGWQQQQMAMNQQAMNQQMGMAQSQMAMNQQMGMQGMSQPFFRGKGGW